MREYKFRGYFKGYHGIKPMWCYGSLIVEKNGGCCIITDDGGYDVDPDSVGQFIGTKDQAGGEIYEGDIIEWVSSDGDNRTDEVEFKGGAFHLCNSLYPVGAYFNLENRARVIGNKYENPELLEVNND